MAKRTKPPKKSGPVRCATKAKPAAQASPARTELAKTAALASKGERSAQTGSRRGFPIVGIGASAGGPEAEEQMEKCRRGETVRSVQFVRLDKSGQEHKGLLTFSLLTDESSAPEAIAMTIKHIV